MAWKVVVVKHATRRVLIIIVSISALEFSVDHLCTLLEACGRRCNNIMLSAMAYPSFLSQERNFIKHLTNCKVLHCSLLKQYFLFPSFIVNLSMCIDNMTITNHKSHLNFICQKDVVNFFLIPQILDGKACISTFHTLLP
jgi:hypothetical protein